jgi:hypothetical protein
VCGFSFGHKLSCIRLMYPVSIVAGAEVVLMFGDLFGC